MTFSDMEDLITISFPVYNVASTIERSLMSALNQTYSNLEYLIVDDCGSDNSMDILKNILHNTSRKDQVKIIRHSSNKGLGAVRNTSIENASGKYIYFMDSDDMLSADCIEKLSGAMKKYKVDFVASSHAIVNGGGEIIEEKKYWKETLFINNSDIINYYYRTKGDLFVFMWNKLYNIEFLRKYKICCVHPIVEDDLFLFQTLFCSSSCCLISDITYFYYVNPLSITNTLMKENISLSVAKIYSDILAYKYKTTIQCATRESVVYILLFVFTESIFRASAIVQSSSIKLQEKKEILRIMLYPPALSMNWKFWYKLESKFKLKLLLYNFFVISCFNLKFMFIRQIPRISYFLKQ